MPRIVKSIIESIGVYLPAKQVTTAEIMKGCVHPVRLPLERLTGIRSRHRAGESEFAIDLATKSVEDCMHRANLKPADVDLLICANISRFDGPHTVGYEPSTAITLKKHFGFERAVAWDISNACAGMWTAVYVADAMIRNETIRHALIVSGEYISHLTDTAQKEVVDAMDPQIASLTLGDAGVAIAMGLSPSPDIGFHDIDLCTLGEFSRYCIAKPTDRAHGGAAMHTDPIKITAAVVPQSAKHADQMLARNGRNLHQIEHIVPHQTSRLTMRSALNEIGGQYDVDLESKLVDNLAERGNTASTAHFLALRDCCLNHRIRTGDEILFLISGSGQTLGSALYTCDDLPDRTRSTNGASQAKINGVPRSTCGGTLPVPMQVESIGVSQPDDHQHADSLEMLDAASLGCLAKSQFSKADIELLVSVGVYRTEFLTEPAIAALLAGDLQLTNGRQLADAKVPLAFDLLNGSVGFLNACYLVSELARVGCLERAMIVASEVENNLDVAPHDLVGVREMGSATILQPAADGESGFQAFGFYHYPDHHGANTVTANWNEAGRTYLKITRSNYLLAIYQDCIKQGVRQFLTEQGLTTGDFDWLLPPQISSKFTCEVIQRLGFAAETTIDVSDDGLDLATSATPVAMQAALADERVSKGDLGLIVNVGSGVQVACAIYRF